MATILLVLIYLAFISLGLPDSILGSAWPVIRQDLGAPVSYAGFIAMTVSGGTILSSLFSDKLIRKYGTGVVTNVSIFLTASALFLTYFSQNYIWLFAIAIPLGLGAGAIDSALNNFVALHYKSSHMNWLHCFWGIGATTGPIIMSFHLSSNGNWRNGYFIISIIQIALMILVLFSLPLWKRFEHDYKSTLGETEATGIGIIQVFQLKGAKPALIAFFAYCAAELTLGLWGSTYLVSVHEMDAKSAARWVSFYYFGITIGRFFSGFLALKINNRRLIRLGEFLSLTGGIILLFSGNPFLFLVSFILMGVGFAPIYPAMLHETPNRFGTELSQSIMGIQMAFAYVGSTFMPPVFGLIAKSFGFWLLPVYLILFILIMLLSTEYLNNLLHKKVK